MKVRAPGLAGWLAIVTALLVTIAVATVSVAGVRLLRGLAESEALTRVELGVAAAREGLRQGAEDMLTAARVLGERPTLRRLLRDANSDALTPYLHRYCEGAGLDACAVVRQGSVVALIGDDLAWDQILVSAAEQGERFLVTGVSTDHAHIGASAPVIENADVTAISLRRMDQRFADRLSERAGLEIRIVDFASFLAGEGPLAVLNSDALSRSEAVAGHVSALDVYAASMPVAASTGETIALVQAILPASDVFEPVASLSRRMLWIAVVVALLATASGILIGRHWIGGVQRLTGAAGRIGSGDLSALIPAESGKELGVLAATMEDMRRNLVELTSELRRSEAEAQAVIGGIVEGVYAVDRDRRIRFLNPQAEKLLRISASDALGQFCGDLLKPSVDGEGRRPCESSCPILAARRAGAADAVELIEPIPGRVRRAVIVSAAPAEGIQVQVLRDETELEAVRRTRDTVLANISHEFRTPLAAQLASIELLHEGLDSMTLEQQRGLVDSLQRGAQRLTWLIDNLLESVRIESGQLAIRRQDVVLDDMIRAARDLVEPLIEQRGQKLEVRTVEEVPIIRGDRQRLVQVLVNLLANASKFGPPDSVIRIGARTTQGGGLTFWVDDEGAGPADADDAALFEQFHRAGGEDPEESGLGLGLYIVRSIVERHGGRASLMRTPEGRTRAQIELPRDIQA
jgi:signal transduction histidine kinase